MNELKTISIKLNTSSTPFAVISKKDLKNHEYVIHLTDTRPGPVDIDISDLSEANILEIFAYLSTGKIFVSPSSAIDVLTKILEKKETVDEPITKETVIAFIKETNNYKQIVKYVNKVVDDKIVTPKEINEFAKYELEKEKPSTSICEWLKNFRNTSIAPPTKTTKDKEKPDTVKKEPDMVKKEPVIKEKVKNTTKKQTTKHKNTTSKSGKAGKQVK